MRISEQVKAHLQWLEQNGRLTPEVVVADARHEASPLHGMFDWDAAKAAEQHWLDRARQIIRAVKVVVVTTNYTIKAPYYVPDPSRSGKEQGYTSVVSLKQDEVLARQALIQECERAAGVLKRARSIAFSLGLEDDVNEILTHVTGLRYNVENGIRIPVEEAAADEANQRPS